MNGIFFGAIFFNQLLDLWDVSQVSTMFSMFYNAESFNQPLGLWDVSQVYTTFGMFGSYYNRCCPGSSSLTNHLIIGTLVKLVTWLVCFIKHPGKTEISIYGLCVFRFITH